MSKQKPKGSVVYFCIILLLVLVMIFSGLQILESTIFHTGQESGRPTTSKTIVRDGVEYFPRQDITVFMVLGIDKFGPVEASPSYNNSGLADVISLLIFDETNQNCRILQLNRDTMLDVRVLGLGGRYAGTRFGQLALAHMYGTGLEDSCENTRETVSQFLYGLHIDYYMSMNMDAISVMTDAVGGVQVEVKDDFSAVDPTIQMGQMLLNGQQAINFVRTRKDVADQMNVTRMQRHREFMNGLLSGLQTKLDSDETFALNTYESVSSYIVTDCSGNVISSIAERYGDYPLVEIVSPEGENKKGTQYMEFYVDADKLDALILRLFYAPK
ncbi:MAG: hypothetical protein E7448_03515 [Ruminococcaceae bacterium]|nr:hypothetical protein [Oscillospiraceae bacterium]